MKIEELKNSFDALTPTDEAKERMLSKIMEAEEKRYFLKFDFKRLGGVAIGLAAVVAITALVYKADVFKNTDTNTYVARVAENTEEKKEENIKEKTAEDYKAETYKKEVPSTNDKKTDTKTDKKTDIKKNKIVNKTEVASANPVSEARSYGISLEPEINFPAVVSRVRMIDNEEDAQTLDAEKDNPNVSEEEKNYDISVDSEIDKENEGEWLTLPSLENISELEEDSTNEENLKDDDVNKENEEEK